MNLTAALLESLFTVAASAPSAHNTQPWIPTVADCTPSAAEVRVTVDPARTLPFGDPRSEDLHLSMGCWVESLTIAAAEAGLRTESVTVEGHGPTLDIRVRLTPEDSTADSAGTASASTGGSVWPSFTVADLHHRQVDRGPLVRNDDRFAEAVALCRDAQPGSAVCLAEIPDRLWRGWLRRAALHSYGDPSVFAETLRWLRFDTEDPTYHRDGLTAECLRISAVGARAAAALDRPGLRPWIVGFAAAALTPVSLVGQTVRAFAGSELGSRFAALSQPLRRRLTGPATAAAPKPKVSGRTAWKPPHHLVLSVPEHPALSTAEEIEIGRILLRIWLTLDRHGVRVDVHSEIKDSPTIRREVAAHLGEVSARPIAAFTVGVSSTSVPRAPRLLSREP